MLTLFHTGMQYQALDMSLSVSSGSELRVRMIHHCQSLLVNSRRQSHKAIHSHCISTNLIPWWGLQALKHCVLSNTSQFNPTEDSLITQKHKVLANSDHKVRSNPRNSKHYWCPVCSLISYCNLVLRYRSCSQFATNRKLKAFTISYHGDSLIESRVVSNHNTEAVVNLAMVSRNVISRCFGLRNSQW